MKRIVVLADIHVGSKRGLNPRRYFNANTNSFQKWAIEKWEEFVEKYKHPDYLVLNGDIIEGPEDNEKGTEAETTSFNEQLDRAEELLKPLIGKNTQVFTVNGSGYHSGKAQALKSDWELAKRLGATHKGSVFELKIGKELIQFAHGRGSTFNPTAYLNNERTQAEKSYAKRHGVIPNLMVRSHLHTYTVCGDAAVTSYVTPCWQFTTEFMEQKSANVFPDIGALIIEVDEEERYPAKVYPVIYPLEESLIEEMRNFEIYENIRIQKQKEEEMKKNIEAKRRCS